MPVPRRRTAGLCELQRPEADRDARKWRLRAREFAEEVVRPLGLALDRLPVAQTVAPGSPIHEFLDQAQSEGFMPLRGINRDLGYLVLEEIAAADAGLAGLLITAPVAAQRVVSACLHSPARPGRFRLEHDGSGGQLTGATRAPVIGAATATHAVIVCAAAGALAGQALVIVPLDRTGVRRQLLDSQRGLRAGAAATLTLDCAPVNGGEVIELGDRSCPPIARALALDHVAVAILSVGIARSAYEGAARWERERGSDAPHRIAVMRAMLERARSVTRAAHVHLDAGRTLAAGHAAFARMLASQTAAELARQSLWMIGARAFDPDGVEHLDGSRFQPEKLVRDAHEHGFMVPGRVPAARAQAVHPLQQRSTRWGL